MNVFFLLPWISLLWLSSWICGFLLVHVAWFQATVFIMFWCFNAFLTTILRYNWLMVNYTYIHIYIYIVQFDDFWHMPTSMKPSPNEEDGYFHHPQKFYSALCNSSLLPPLSPGNHWYTVCHYLFSFPRILNTWKHTVPSSLCLVSFIQLNDSDIHAGCYVYQ